MENYGQIMDNMLYVFLDFFKSYVQYNTSVNKKENAQIYFGKFVSEKHNYSRLLL